jgi:hypothetical protein
MCKQSVDAPCAQLERVLRTAVAVGVHPCESPLINFEADTMPLRRMLHSFGTLVNPRPQKVNAVSSGVTSLNQTCESLPADLEDYEDEETSSNMLLQTKTFTDDGQRQFMRLKTSSSVCGQQADGNIRQWLSQMRMDSEDHEPNLYTKVCLWQVSSNSWTQVLICSLCYRARPPMAWHNCIRDWQLSRTTRGLHGQQTPTRIFRCMHIRRACV